MTSGNARKNSYYTTDGINVNVEVGKNAISDLLREAGYSDKEINKISIGKYEEISMSLSSIQNEKYKYLGTDLIEIKELSDEELKEENIDVCFDQINGGIIRPYETISYEEFSHQILELSSNTNDERLRQLFIDAEETDTFSILSKDSFVGECASSANDNGVYIDRDTFTAIVKIRSCKYILTIKIRFYITDAMGNDIINEENMAIFLHNYQFDFENGITYDIYVNRKKFTLTDKNVTYKTNNFGEKVIYSSLKNTDFFFIDYETIKPVKIIIFPIVPTDLTFNIPEYVCNNPDSVIDDIEMVVTYDDKKTKAKISESSLAQLFMKNVSLENGDEYGYNDDEYDYKEKFKNSLLYATVSKKTYRCVYKELYYGESISFNYTVNVQRYVSDINLDLTNFKKEYYVGEELEFTNSNATIKYYESGMDAKWKKNQKEESLTITKENIIGFSSEKAGEVKLKVNVEGYSDGIYTINCLIKENPLVSIALKQGSLGKTFIAYVEMDLSDSYLICTYESGKVEEIQITEDMITGYENKAGTQEITIKYGNQETKASIEVYEVKKLSLYEDSKIYYVIGEENPELYLKCTFTNDDYDIVMVSELNDFDTSSKGTKNLNVTYANIDFVYTYVVLSDVYVKYSIINNSVVITDFTIDKPTDKYFELANPKEVVIPEVVEELPVTGIDSNAFDGASFINKVILPQTLTSIGSYAFRNCSSLEYINIPTNVSTIGKNILSGDVKLLKLETSGNTKLSALFDKTEVKNLEVMINNDVDILTDNFVDNNINFEVKKLIFGQSLQSLGKQNYLRKVNEFESNSEIIKVIENVIYTDSGRVLAYYSEKKTDKEFICPNTVEVIDFFKDNNFIEKVTIPQSVKTLGDSFLSDCSKLNNLIFEGEIETLPSGMLRNTVSLTEFTFPKGVKVIDDILSYSAVKDIKIPDTTVEISTSAFYNSDVERMYIPASTTAIFVSSYSFSLPKLKSLAYDGSIRLKSTLFFDSFSQKTLFPYFDTVYLTGEKTPDSTLYQVYTIRNLYVDKKVTTMNNYVIGYGDIGSLNIYCEGTPKGFTEYKSYTYNYNVSYEKWWE